ncbi:MAG: PVC-type heme-binding CxxCH protein [Bacteroidota bacterium]
MRCLSSYLAALLLFAFGCTSSQRATLTYSTVNNGVQDLTLQNPLEATQTLDYLTVPDGFEVQLFAAEPNIVNPIALTWDERGRLWVVESTNYPHDHVGEETGTDRITICEDTDGDGTADRFIRFAENQPLTTSIALTKDGALVGQAPDIVLLTDTDGDDQYDTKSVVIDDAFGTWDTHAVMSNFKYGIDNHIYSAVGYSGMYEPGRVGDENARTLRQGVFRFAPDGTALEPIAEFNNNTWGLGIGEDNTIFGSTANNNHAVVVGIPMRYGLEKNEANVQSHYLVEHTATTPLQQVDFRDGYTAAAGAFPYTGRRYPEAYWGALMVNEPTAHVVHAGYLERDGAIYKETENSIDNLLSSADDWVAPVFADIGPDENIWVADWYNPVIQHNPDRRGMRNQVWNADRGEGNAHLNPLRDRQHGRVYVVRYTERDGDDIASLDPADGAALIRGLQSTNQFWRLTAQRLIVEHNHTHLVPALRKLVQNTDVDAHGMNPAAVHALWALHGLDAIDEALAEVTAALGHPCAAVRKAAVQVLPKTAETGATLQSANLFADANLNTRLAAVLAVYDLGAAADDDLKAATQAALRGGDEWIEAAVEGLAPSADAPAVASTPAPELDTSIPPRAVLSLDVEPLMMSFAQPTLHAYANQPIDIVFTNTNPDRHNVLVLKADTDVDAFGQALNGYITADDAWDNAYVPPSMRDRVLAASTVLAPGDAVTLSLDGLPAGEYTYICTVPGHWMMMQGTLVVEDAAPALARNDAGWSWLADAEDAPSILYLAGAANRDHQSHWHSRVFGFASGQVLYASGANAYTYTESSDAGFVEQLADADLLVMSNNKPVEPAAKDAIFAHVEAGKPLLLSHPATWYNWKDWPRYNAELVGGGSRSHEKLQTFSVEVVQPNHPMMEGVPASFEVFDELYRAELLPDANAVVLAIGRSHETGKIYPVVWTRQVGEATVVMNTLGHDDRVHNLVAYKRILANTRDWLLP